MRIRNLCPFASLNSDIALVRLAHPIEFTSDVSAARISCSSPPVGRILDVSGAGATDQATEAVPDGPLVVSVPVINKVTGCVPTNLNAFARLSTFCTAAAACYGDSGGPAAYFDETRGYFILHGVVAYGGGTVGTSCDKPCGYTDVAWFQYPIHRETGIVCV